MLQEEIAALNAVGIYELRIILRDLGGTPSTKPKPQLIKEIIEITDGVVTPKRSPRGRKPAKSTIVKGGATQEEGDNRSLDTVLDSGRGVVLESATGLVCIRAEGNACVYPCDKLTEGICLPNSLVEKHLLRNGDLVDCRVEWDSQTGLSVTEILSVNGMAGGLERMDFEAFTSCYPNSRYNLYSKGMNKTFKLMDLLCPLGKGQRCLVLARTSDEGLSFISLAACAIKAANPGAVVVAALIDERPEDVTEFKYTNKCELISSPFDQSAEHHALMAELAISRGKRVAEMGGDAVVLINSLSRLVEAYGQTEPTHADAMLKVKRLFGSARNTEEGGSLTIIATASKAIENNEKQRDINQFADMCNMEVFLVGGEYFVDFNSSHTIRDEALLSFEQRLAAAACKKALIDGNVDLALACIED